MKQKRLSEFLGWLKNSAWAFPAIVVTFLVVLTLLRISGTSAGTYHLLWYGSDSHDSHLIYGQPRTIRSDEWLVHTQTAISQSKLGFPQTNPSLGAGQMLSLQTEEPTKEWPTIFKPQLWSYFVLPLEYAFAFKWWFLMALLIISCYFFTLRVLPKRKDLAITFSLAIGLTPFMLWWWQSSVFLAPAYGFLIIILAMRLVNGEPVRSIKSARLNQVIYWAVLSFLLACFGLLFYPPFQIPVAIVVFLFLLGYIGQKLSDKDIRLQQLIRPFLTVLAALVVTAFIGLAFYVTHKTPIHALNNSTYPGHRRVMSGGLNKLNVFDSFLMPIEQSDSRGAYFFNNQSETSNFILLLPFLLIPGVALLAWEWRLKKRPDWSFLAIQLCAILFFIRVFTPLGDGFFRFLLLDRVPHPRLVIGLGFVGILEILYIVRKIGELDLPRKILWPLSALYSLACFVALMLIGVHVMHHYPRFIHFSHDLWVITFLAGFFAAIIASLLAGWRRLAVGLFLAFSLLACYRIVPLYQGLAILTDNQVIRQMKSISGPSDTWVTVGRDAWLYENFGLLAGERSLSGSQFYPTTEFWSQVVGPQYKDIYNREGHAFFVDKQEQTEPVKLLQADAFTIKFQCSDYIKEHVDFALSVHPLTYSCLALKDMVSYPRINFYLYSVEP